MTSVLVVNAGSTSLKLRRLDGEDAAGAEDLPGGEPDRGALREAIERLNLDLVEPRVLAEAHCFTGGQRHSEISGASSPCSRAYARARSRASSISCRR